MHARGQPIKSHETVSWVDDLTRTAARLSALRFDSRLSYLGRLLACLHLRDPALIECDEIDRMEQERRKAAIRDRGRDDLAGKREQQPRALDHEQGPEVLLRDIDQAEHAAVIEIEGEQDAADQLRLALELELDLEVGGRHLSRVDVDLDADLRLLLLEQRVRRVGVFERKILDVLRKDAEARTCGLGRCRGRFTAIRRIGHGVLRPKPTRSVPLWLTQPTGPNKDGNLPHATG